MSLSPCHCQCDHVPSPTNPSEGEGVDVDDDEIERTIRDLHGDYDYGDDRVSTAVVASVSESKQRESGDVEDDEEDDDDEEEDQEGDDDQEEGESAGSNEAVNAADALALAVLELRAREDKAAMDRLVVAMAGDGVVVWRHQSGFHKEMVGD